VTGQHGVGHFALPALHPPVDEKAIPDAAARPTTPGQEIGTMATKVLNARTRVERRAEPPVYRQQVTKAVNPATFEVIGSVPMTSEGQIPGFVDRARRAAAA
jgi:hypothetical protein